MNIRRKFSRPTDDDLTRLDEFVEGPDPVREEGTGKGFAGDHIRAMAIARRSRMFYIVRGERAFKFHANGPN